MKSSNPASPPLPSAQQPIQGLSAILPTSPLPVPFIQPVAQPQFSPPPSLSSISSFSAPASQSPIPLHTSPYLPTAQAIKPTSPIVPPRKHTPPPTLVSTSDIQAENQLHEKIHIQAQALAQEILRQESIQGISNSKRNPFEQWVDYLGPFNIGATSPRDSIKEGGKKPSNPFLENL
ncbi:hypothetical protein M1146_07400 [Patescibacteria group bacterium]|nr:hypothetical protein [Patescibacteria group bacterium]